jgi:hypothetical protein
MFDRALPSLPICLKLMIKHTQQVNGRTAILSTDVTIKDNTTILQAMDQT